MIQIVGIDSLPRFRPLGASAPSALRNGAAGGPWRWALQLRGRKPEEAHASGSDPWESIGIHGNGKKVSGHHGAQDMRYENNVVISRFKGLEGHGTQDVGMIRWK